MKAFADKLLRTLYRKIKLYPQPAPKVVVFLQQMCRKLLLWYDWRKTCKVYKALESIGKICANPAAGQTVDYRTFLVLPYLALPQVKEKYGSQCFQALFVAEILYPGKKNGFFLDIGGNDPIHINNTNFLEKIGWTGLAFEPVPALNKKWQEVGRTTPCLPICLGDRETTVSFCEYENHFMSAPEGKSAHADAECLVKTYEVPCRRLADVLMEHQVTTVDYISLDVEGCEMDVLRGIDFDNVSIGAIIIENTGALAQVLPLRKYLHDKGFTFVARLWHDDVFVSAEVYKTLIGELG